MNDLNDTSSSSTGTGTPSEKSLMHASGLLGSVGIHEGSPPPGSSSVISACATGVGRTAPEAIVQVPSAARSHAEPSWHE